MTDHMIKPFPDTEGKEADGVRDYLYTRLLEVNSLKIGDPSFTKMKNLVQLSMDGNSADLAPDQQKEVVNHYGLPNSFASHPMSKLALAGSMPETDPKSIGWHYSQINIDESNGNGLTGLIHSARLVMPSGSIEHDLVSYVDKNGINTVTVTDRIFDAQGKETSNARQTIEIDYKKHEMHISTNVNGQEAPPQVIDTKTLEQINRKGALYEKGEMMMASALDSDNLAKAAEWAATKYGAPSAPPSSEQSSAPLPGQAKQRSAGGGVQV